MANRCFLVLLGTFVLGVQVYSASDDLCNGFPSGEINYLLDPYNCSQYYECFGGKLYILNCPPGLYWNQNAKYCDYKDNVKCEAIPDNSTTTTTPKSTATPSGEVNPLCKGFSPEIVSYLVYPYNCSKYYECFEGKLYIMDCPTNLYWNQDGKYWENVKCEVAPDNSTTTTTPKSTTTPSEDNSTTTTTPKSTTTPSGEVNPLCKGFSPEIVSYLVYPYNCSKYYECFEGKLYIMDCPTNLYWNQDGKYCDYWENVKCEVVPDNSTTTTTPKFTTTPSGEVSCEEEPNGTYFADPNDCKGFFECSNGQAVEQWCSAGLVWNQNILNCAYDDGNTCQ